MAYLLVVILIAIISIGAVILGLNIQQNLQNPNSLASKHPGTAANDGNNLIPVAVVNPVNPATTNAISTSLEPVAN